MLSDRSDSPRSTSSGPSARRRPVRLPGVKVLPGPARKLLRREILAVLSREGAAPDYDAPVGDPGLFGPDSVTWKVHADFPAMMAGGLASLMLQVLHPLALAGVWDHSRFRGDMLGRLRNTIAFVARTTYAPREPAEQAIARVRGIHRKVTGVTPDGRCYRADDPHLLNWVHVAECWCFLRAYRVYGHQRLTRAMQDRYLREVARIPEALGAKDVPQSMADMEAFFHAVRGELVFGARAREVLAALHAVDLPIPMPSLGRGVFLHAGAALLPDWAHALMQRSRRDRLRDRAAAGCLKWVAPSIRDAMAEGGLAWRACARTGADYASLFRW